MGWQSIETDCVAAGLTLQRVKGVGAFVKDWQGLEVGPFTMTQLGYWLAGYTVGQSSHMVDCDCGRVACSQRNALLAKKATIIAALTERQKDIMRHALGLNGGRPVERNHFCAGDDSEDWADLLLLSECGLMKDNGTNEVLRGMHVFQVTEEGKAVVS